MMDFLFWYREYKLEHPEVGMNEAQAIYEDNLLKNMKWMYELGWNREEV